MSIAQKAARGVAWNMAFGVSSRVLQLVGTLLLTRFIAPDDYGDVLAASISVVTAGVLTSFAFGQYLIARKAPPEVAFQAMQLHVALGVVAVAVLYALRAPAGRLIDTPGMTPYVLGFCVAHLIDRVRYVPERLLMRDLRFRAIATINGSGEIAFTIAALALADAHGPYAIVYGFLVRSTLTSILFLAVSPRAQWLVWSPLRRDDVRGLFAYGLPIMIGALADRAATRWDSLLMSKLFGPGVMGRYNLSFSLAEMPISHVAEHIGEVLMPSFSAMEPEERRSAVVRGAAALGLVIAPLGVGLGAIAPTLVDAFFDARWQGMAPMLMILSVMTIFRPMVWAAVAYLQAVQQTRLVMWSSFFRAVVVLALVAAFGHLGGPLWACVGAGIGYAVHSVATIVVVCRATGLPLGPYLVALGRPLLPSIPMFGAVYGAGRALEALGVIDPVSLVLQVVLGAVVYVAAAFVLVGPTARELLRVGRQMLRRRRAR